MRRPLSSMLVVMLALQLAVAACGSSSASHSASKPPPTATASASAEALPCHLVTTINQALSSLSNLTVSTTVGDVKAAQAKVANATKAIQAQHPTDPQGFVSQVSAANDKLTEKLAGYPDQTPISQTSDTAPDLKTKVADAQGKTDQLAAELKCTP